MKKFIILLFLSLFIYLKPSAQEIPSPKKMLSTYYDDWFEGRITSSGHVFSQENYTAAHLNIPLGTLLLVINPKNNRWVIVMVNDRCPKRGVLDLSKSSAEQLDFIYEGVTNVETYTLPDSLFALWEFQDVIFENYPDCSFEEWSKLSYFVTGTSDLSEKPYSKQLTKASDKIAQSPKKKAVSRDEIIMDDSLLVLLPDSSKYFSED